MVSVTAHEHSSQERLLIGLNAVDAERVRAALDFVQPHYAGKAVIKGQDAYAYATMVASIVAQLETDADTRIAALLFEMPALAPAQSEQIEAQFGKDVVELVAGIRQLMRLHETTFDQPEQEHGKKKNAQQRAALQLETLRKMLLAMATDMRAVLVRLASRVATLRHFSEQKLYNERTHDYGRVTLDLYAPLANRLGVWQLKWELEDLSFRFIDPDTYRRIAKMLEEKRLGRESFIAEAIARLQTEMASAGIDAEVTGRPKHIFSIWNKMQGKSLDFSEMYDVRAFRVIVEDIKTCYTVLGIVHHIWTSIPAEFDDYIARPKGNGYQSLHTVVIAEDGRPIEVQIRTREMQHFAEYGVAAHWRYKESGGSNFAAQKYDEKIAWLRQLLAWKNEITDAVVGQEEEHREWLGKLKSATLDDHIYVLTPQGRVLELPNGGTPIDFAYYLHSDVGHRCRGARVDGAMVPLNTPLKNGQTVEIITAKGSSAASAGPSRDWLSQGYAASPRTRSKVRAWFNALDQQATLAVGRGLIEKTLQREGKTAINLEELSHKLGFSKPDDLFLSVGKEEFSLRNVEIALHEGDAAKQLSTELDAIIVPRKSSASSVMQGANSGVLVVGTEGLLTQLAKCCKPAPPDGIVGFITRGKGVSIHRSTCKNFAEMLRQAPERVIQTTWGSAGKETVYPIDIFIIAQDRQGLLRDVSEILMREKINVIGVSSQSAKGQARMAFTAEIGSTAQLAKALKVIHEVPGVIDVRRK